MVDESKELVRQAKQKLSEIDSNVITLQVSKQTARWILHIQEDMIAEFQKEGILSEKDAHLLLGEVQRDLNHLGNVEWSSIILSKLIHKFESYICYRCYHPSALLSCCGIHTKHGADRKHDDFPEDHLSAHSQDEEMGPAAEDEGVYGFDEQDDLNNSSYSVYKNNSSFGTNPSKKVSSKNGSAMNFMTMSGRAETDSFR